MVRRHLRLPRKRWLPREQQVQTSQAGSTCPVAESEGRGGGDKQRRRVERKARGLWATVFTIMSSETGSSEGVLVGA